MSDTYNERALVDHLDSNVTGPLRLFAGTYKRERRSHRFSSASATLYTDLDALAKLAKRLDGPNRQALMLAPLYISKHRAYEHPHTQSFLKSS